MTQTTAVEIATILELLHSVDNADWDNIKTAEDARRALLHRYHKSFEPATKVLAPSQTYPLVGQRVLFPTTTRPKRIAGCTAVVKEILAKGNVKVNMDGTSEVFTRVPRSSYTIVTDDTFIPAVQSATRRSRY